MTQSPQNRRPAGGRNAGAFSQLRGSDGEAPPLTPAEDRRWATLSHFGAVAGCVPALVIWLVFRDRGPFTAQESKESLNFALPLTVVMLVFYGLAFIPAIDWVAGLGAVFVWAFMAISGLIGGIECNKGRPYRYTMNLRLVR